MSTTLIPEPLDNNPMTEDWQKTLIKITKTSASLLLVTLTGSAPNYSIKTGSRLEVNGSYYQSIADTAIANYAAIGLNRFFYIYAVPAAGGASLTFSCSISNPTFQVEKGGWFLNNDRAIILAYKNNSSAIWSWSLITDNKYMPLDKVEPDLTGDPTMGTEQRAGNWTTVILSKGWYKVSLGGGGGAAVIINHANAANSKGGAGGALTHCFYVPRSMPAYVMSGQRGTATAGAQSTQANPHACSAGGGGSVLDVPELNLILIAGGGGGTTYTANWVGGDGGSYGGGSNGYCAAGAIQAISNRAGKCGHYLGGNLTVSEIKAANNVVHIQTNIAQAGEGPSGAMHTELFAMPESAPGAGFTLKKQNRTRKEGGLGSSVAGGTGEAGGNNLNATRGGGGAGGIGVNSSTLNTQAHGGEGWAILYRYEGQMV